MGLEPKAPALRKGLLGTALTISSREYDDVTLKAARHFAATAFAEEVKEAWTRFNLAALEKEAARLDGLLARVLALAAPSRYPSACQIAPLLDDARELDASILSKLNTEAIGPEAVARIAPVRKFAADPLTCHGIFLHLRLEPGPMLRCLPTLDRPNVEFSGLVTTTGW